jgi:hypothetical protein
MVCFSLKKKDIGCWIMENLAMIENQESLNNFVYLKSLPKQPWYGTTVPIYLAACCLFFMVYHFYCAKKHFTANRWFLLAGLVTSVVLPLVVLLKIIWVDPNPVAMIGRHYPKRSHTEDYIVKIYLHQFSTSYTV